jgi:hypothetical protein
MTPTATTAPQIPLGHDTDGALVSVPSGRILIAGDVGTGKTVLAGRIAAAGQGALRWVIHERHHDHAYPDADQRATSSEQAALLLDAAYVLTRVPRHPGAARVQLTVDDAYLIDPTHRGLLATPDTGIDLTLIAPSRLPRHIADTFGVQLLFRHAGPACPYPDLAADLARLPNRAALLIRPGTIPTPITIPTHTPAGA